MYKYNLRISLLISFFIVIAANSRLVAQTLVQGFVTDAQNRPISDVGIVIKNTSVSGVTKQAGAFQLLSPVAEGVLQISHIGYETLEISFAAGKVLQPIQMKIAYSFLDEVVVTGVFDAQHRLESSVAITVLDQETINRVVPTSAVDLLRNVPGVLVYTVRGEIYNSVTVRGMIGGGDYNFVSMQEDGLPVIPAAGQFLPDAFLRADITLGRLEALRGGTASILGANAPGGVFNNISRTGTGQFEGEFRTRLGMEGNLNNPYYRAEMAFGGPFSKKDTSLTWFIGGHYRHSNGPKHPGYPFSRGGQWKGNMVKKYKNGQLKFSLKFLRDRAMQMESTPTVDFNKPRPAGQFTNSSSLLNPNLNMQFPASVVGVDVDFASENLNLYTDLAPALHWQHNFGGGWSIENAARYSSKTAMVNSTWIVYPFSMDKFWFYAFYGLLGKTGTYKFYDPHTGEEFGTVEQAFDFSNPELPFSFTANLNLPGSEVQPNSLFFQPLGIEDSWMRDFTNQTSIKKRMKNMTFTAGAYHASTRMHQFLLPPAAMGFSTIEDQPRYVGIKYIPSDTSDHAVYHLTDENGVGFYGIGGLFENSATVRQTAFFFGHNWDISPKLNLDYGMRNELFSVKGNIARLATQTVSLGGIDGDSTTLYDNTAYQRGNYIDYGQPLNTFSFSAGLNYRLKPSLAVYARFARGSKIPDASFYNDNTNQLRIEAQQTLQYELGVRLQKGHNSLAVTPFYSAQSKIPLQQSGNNIGLPITQYATPTIYNKNHVIGIEAEGVWAITKQWSIRGNAILQQFTVDKYQYWNTRLDGPADDTLIDRSHLKITPNVPKVILNLAPIWQHNGWSASLNWYHISRRPANASETFYLPAYSQFDLQISRIFSSKLTAQLAVNNLFNTFGVMSWTAPTTSGFAFSTFDTDLFTPENRAANPDAVYYTMALQPRACFLTMRYVF